MSLIATRNTDLLATAPIARLLYKFAVPAVIAALVNALYNIVDRLYIGRAVSGDAMAGLVLTFPYMLALSSFGVLVGAGSSAMLSIRLGAGDNENAERIVGQCVALKVLFFVTIPIAAFYLMEPCLRFFGATEQALPYAQAYLNVIVFGCIFSHLSFGLSGLIRAEGDAKMAMTIMMVGAISNILFDPIFIFGGLGMPWLMIGGHRCFIDFGLPGIQTKGLMWGLKGAAWATVVSMFISTLVGIIYMASSKSRVRLRLRKIMIYPKLVWKVFAVGLSPALMQIVSCFVNVVFNHGYKNWAGDETEATRYLAAIGIIQGVHIFALMPACGVALGAQPIIGYNFGAGKYARMMKCTKLSTSVSTALSLMFFVLILLTAKNIAAAFVNPAIDKSLYDTTKWGLWVLALGFPLFASPLMLGTYYQSVGMDKASVLISLLRQVLILIPLIVGLPYIFGVDGVWYAQPVADVISAAICTPLMIHERRKILKMIEIRKHKFESSLTE